MSTFTDERNCTKISKKKFLGKIKQGNFDMRLVPSEAALVVKLINKGIDSHLEACFVPERGDTVSLRTGKIAVLDNQDVHGVADPKGRYVEFSFSPLSLYTLVRRLFEDTEHTGEDGDEADVGWTLAGDILDMVMEDRA